MRVSRSTLTNPSHRDMLSDAWFRRLRNVVFPVLPTNRRAEDRVKIAILDSGIDLNENSIFVKRNQIKYQSFLPNEEGIEDLIGHGTHCAALLLRVAPNSDIYVARITSSGSLDTTDSIENVTGPLHGLLIIEIG
jgi:subtilisin family serine protease